MWSCTAKILPKQKPARTKSRKKRAWLISTVTMIPLAALLPMDDRAFGSSDVSAVHVRCTVETRNHQHLAELRTELKSHGVETYDTK